MITKQDVWKYSETLGGALQSLAQGYMMSKFKEELAKRMQPTTTQQWQSLPEGTTVPFSPETIRAGGYNKNVTTQPNILEAYTSLLGTNPAYSGMISEQLQPQMQLAQLKKAQEPDYKVTEGQTGEFYQYDPRNPQKTLQKLTNVPTPQPSGYKMLPSNKPAEQIKGVWYKYEILSDDKTGQPLAGAQPIPVPMGQPQTISGEETPKVNQTLTGESLLQELNKISPDLAKLVKGTANYEYNPNAIPTRQFRGAKGYTQQQIISLASQYKPSYDMTTFPAKQKYRTDFEGGNMRRRISSMNQLLTHIDTQKRASDAINKIATNQGGIFTKAYNTIGAWAADNMGDPRVTAFNTAAERVADECAAFYKGGTASATDIGQEKERILNQIKNAPMQKDAYLNTTMELLSGAVASLRESYSSVMDKEPEPNKIIYPTARRALQSLKKAGVQFDMNEIDPSGGGIEPETKPKDDPLGIF